MAEDAGMDRTDLDLGPDPDLDPDLDPDVDPDLDPDLDRDLDPDLDPELDGAPGHAVDRAAGVGVGPHPQPWPEGAEYDADLLREGDRRNVVDRYRYWSVEAIVADLDRDRHEFHVAIENFEHDFNIGSVVRTANAFNASSVRVVGRRRWNRRGAMVTDRYLRVAHHDDAAALAAWAAAAGLPVIGVDNLPGAVPLETFELPRACVLLFGQEGAGLSEAARTSCSATVSIAQYGSTRSINVGAAAAIAMHAWVRRHEFGQIIGQTIGQTIGQPTAGGATSHL